MSDNHVLFKHYDKINLARFKKSEAASFNHY